MKRLLILTALCFALLSYRSTGAEFKATPEGIHIDAGSLGEFTLTYPELQDGQQKPMHKLVETKLSVGATSLIYDGGNELKLIISDTGEMTFTFLHVGDEVKHVSVSMLIDLAYSKGGKWKIADKSGDFPREKPASPHLYQDHARQFQITNPQGQSMSLAVPEFSYQQLTDNREWNWGIFAWKDVVPFNAGLKEMKFTLSLDQTTAAKKLVDTLGQSTSEAWPDKVKSIEELKADVIAEKSYPSLIKTAELDAFGGLLNSGSKLALNKTGFFHVEKKQDKSWLVDPAGNVFFHTGICGFNPSDDFTYIKGRESIYEWLPKADGEFATAFREGDPTCFSFYVANTIRKYGAPYNADTFAARMIERVRKYGFNSMGAFSNPPPTALQKANFPYVLSLALNEWEGIKRIPGAWEVIDPFDETVRSQVVSQLAKSLPTRANDPLLIGYFLVNEPRFDELPKVIPSLDGSHACKRKFVEFLYQKYTTVDAFNAAWKAEAKSFEELASKGLAVSSAAAREDVKAFVGLFLESYFTLVCDAFRKHDANHMLMGTRLQPVTINDEQLCRISGKHLDVMSFNYYTYDVDKELLKRIHEWTCGLPMILSEFFWSSPRDSGLVGGREVRSQQERGLMYRNYVEQAASLGFVIGIEWFTLVDQSVTGRWFSKYSGESANTGLFSVTDRPWKSMLEEMAKTNHGIYDVVQGQRAPFVWEEAKARGKQ